MRPTLLDTSTLLEFLYAKDLNKFENASQGFYDTIESIILYDSIRYDYSSIKFYINRESRVSDNFKKIEDFCLPIKLTEEEIRLLIYKSYQRLTSIIESSQIGILKSYRGEPNTKDPYGWSISLSLGKLGPEENNPLSIEKHKVNYNSRDYWEKSIFNGEDYLSYTHPFLRIFYYLELQNLFMLNYVPHPSRVALIEEIRSEGLPISKQIIEYFNKRTFASFEKRKMDLLGKYHCNMDIPMLSSYLINRSNNWDELLLNLVKLRNSKEAIRFREAIKEFSILLKENKNLEVDKILLSIKQKAEDWSFSLNNNRDTKPIKVSIPGTGVGTEINVPIVKLTHDTSDDILIFIHKILSNKN